MNPDAAQPLTSRAGTRFSSSFWWLCLSLAAVCGAMVPVLALVSQAVQGSQGLWAHLGASVILTALPDTVI
ncbi:MAG: iron ABC transporter permease, partial [Rhizobium oryzihabitans]